MATDTKKVKGAAKAANLEAALDEVAKIFQESGRPGANKVLFLLSVGVFAQSTDALLQTVQSHKSKVRKEMIDVICFIYLRKEHGHHRRRHWQARSLVHVQDLQR